MRQMLRTAALAGLALSVAACDVEEITFGNVEAASQRHDGWLETDRQTYTVRYTPDHIEIDIDFTFRNHSSSTVAVPHCGRPHRPALDKLISGEWHEVFSPTEACWAEPLLIGPRASRSFTFEVRAARHGDALGPPFRTSHVPGRYRLRWEVYEYDPHAPFRLGRPLPLERRVSNTFRVVD